MYKEFICKECGIKGINANDKDVCYYCDTKRKER